jgi:hypothetical protein
MVKPHVARSHAEPVSLRMARVVSLFIIGVATLLSCRAREPQRPAVPHPLRLTLAFAPPSSCVVSFTDHHFTLPAQEKQLLVALRQQVRSSMDAFVTGGPEIPYKCFGYAIFVAQRAGFARPGFIAEPPAEP